MEDWLKSQIRPLVKYRQNKYPDTQYMSCKHDYDNSMCILNKQTSVKLYNDCQNQIVQFL